MGTGILGAGNWAQVYWALVNWARDIWVPPASERKNFERPIYLLKNIERLLSLNCTRHLKKKIVTRGKIFFVSRKKNYLLQKIFLSLEGKFFFCLLKKKNFSFEEKKLSSEEKFLDYRCVLWHTCTSICTSTSTPNSSLVSHTFMFYTLIFLYFA